MATCSDLLFRIHVQTHVQMFGLGSGLIESMITRVQEPSQVHVRTEQLQQLHISRSSGIHSQTNLFIDFLVHSWPFRVYWQRPRGIARLIVRRRNRGEGGCVCVCREEGRGH